MKSNSHSPPRHRGNYGKWILSIVFAIAAGFGAALAVGIGAETLAAAGAFVGSIAFIGLVFSMAYVYSSSAPPSRKERRVDKGTVGADNRRTKTAGEAMVSKLLESISAGVRRHRLYDGGLAGSTGYAVAAA